MHMGVILGFAKQGFAAASYSPCIWGGDPAMLKELYDTSRIPHAYGGDISLYIVFVSEDTVFPMHMGVILINYHSLSLGSSIPHVYGGI